MSFSNIKLTVAYDGGEFLGWQKISPGPSVEAFLEVSIEKVLQEKVVLQAASRTDAGVHASGQIVNFFTSKKDLNLPLFCTTLNELLPKSIVILDAVEMPEQFHPTLDCQSKEYHYHICLGPIQLPHHRFYSWHCHSLLDISKMREAAAIFLGKHDFTSLCNTRKNHCYQNSIREVTRIEIMELQKNRLRIEIEGNNFLYKMVRNIVGTLVYVGRDKLVKEELIPILKKTDRTQAGVTAPAHGLTLYQVNYISSKK